MKWCNPLLLVKDFNSKEFTISNEFMTNADTPTLAVDNLIRNPINPFTGRVINNDEKMPIRKLLLHHIIGIQQNIMEQPLIPLTGTGIPYTMIFLMKKNWEMIE